MLKIKTELRMDSSLNDVISWTEHVVEENPHISFTTAKISLIPEGYDGWGATWQVLCPITHNEQGKIIWDESLEIWVDQISIPGWALHPSEDLLD